MGKWAALSGQGTAQLPCFRKWFTSYGRGRALPLQRKWPCPLRVLHNYGSHDIAPCLSAWLCCWSVHRPRRDIPPHRHRFLLSTVRCHLHNSPRRNILSHLPGLGWSWRKKGMTNKKYMLPLGENQEDSFLGGCLSRGTFLANHYKI